MHARSPFHQPPEPERAVAPPKATEPQRLLALQRLIGNRATTQLVYGIQRRMLLRVAQQGGTREDWEKTSSEGEVDKRDKEGFVTLVRGCNSDEELAAIVQNDTAGGKTPARRDGAAPSEQQAIAGVAFEGVPWKVTGERQQARRRTNDIEYSTDVATTARFGATRGGVVQVRIQRKYLVKGSGSEGGWFAYRDAPIEGLFYKTASDLRAALGSAPATPGPPPPGQSPSRFTAAAGKQ